MVSVTPVSSDALSGAAADVFAYDVTCLKLGETSFAFFVANHKSSTNTCV
jgi:hypothetical protein